MPVALFGIEDGGLNLAVNLVILVLVVIWLALIYWTWADARRRVADPFLVTVATAVAVIPFIGTVVYAILRPPEFLADVREREIETQASELRMRHLVAQSCPRCEHPIERTWLRCPACRHRLKDPCESCNRPVDPRWSMCPYCETPIGTPERDERRRRSSSAAPARGQRPGGRAQAPRSGGSAPAKGQRGGSAPKPAPQRAEASKRSSDGGEGAPRPRRRSSPTTS